MSAKIDLQDVRDVIALAIGMTPNARDTLTVLGLAVSIAAIRCDINAAEFGVTMEAAYSEAKKITESGLMDRLALGTIQ